MSRGANYVHICVSTYVCTIIPADSAQVLKYIHSNGCVRIIHVYLNCTYIHTVFGAKCECTLSANQHLMVCFSHYSLTMAYMGVRFSIGACVLCKIKYYFDYLLASERSERDTIRGEQIRAGAVYVYMYIYTYVYMYGGTYAIIAYATYM